MTVLAVVLMVPGAPGCGLAPVDSPGPVSFESFGSDFVPTVRRHAKILLVAAPLMIAGIALWLLAERKGPLQRVAP